MKSLILIAITAASFVGFTLPPTNASITVDIKSATATDASFKEGILYTRVSFPGNFLNEGLSKLDFEKGNLQEQMKTLQASTNNSAYAEKAKATMAAMTPEERASMGTMMMAAMMSPIYAKVYFKENRVLAKAKALNYSLESYMNTKDSIGKMVAIANDKSKEAAISFSASNMTKAWEKEEVSAENYTMQLQKEQEKVAGYVCDKVIYTYKKAADNTARAMKGKQAYKLTVWYSPAISKDINFLHPFYFQLDKGILKIEVQYDKSGKSKMLYEVSGIENKKLADADFTVSDVNPIVDWDQNPVQASMNIFSVMMSSSRQ